MAFTRAIGLAACATILATTTVAASTDAARPPASASALARAAVSAPPDPHQVRHGLKIVGYLGRSFEVPYSWPVIDLTAHPSTCVRFDVHAVYLGRPSGEQQCPARGAGRRTGALLVEPNLTRSTDGGVGATTIALDHPISAEIDVTAPGMTVTASYGDDRATIVDALTAAGLPRPADAAAASPSQTSRPSPLAPSLLLPSPSLLPSLPPPPSVRDTAPVEIVRGTNQATGLGFDTCTAPSSAQMTAWASSPFNTVGIYIGGSERACGQASLTLDWITARAKAGWHFMPIYVGWQAAWDALTATASTPAPATLGRQSADDAITQARSLGFGPGALLYYDMESYSTPAATSAAMAFLSAWTAELHVRGYRSAVYSSAATGIADLVANRGKMTEPDVVSIAQWNGVADADLTATPPDAWPAQRAHQYTGGVDVSYGGVRLNIDKDYLSINNTAAVNPTGNPTGSPTANPTASAAPRTTAGATASTAPHATASAAASATARTAVSAKARTAAGNTAPNHLTFDPYQPSLPE